MEFVSTVCVCVSVGPYKFSSQAIQYIQVIQSTDTEHSMQVILYYTSEEAKSNFRIMLKRCNNYTCSELIKIHVLTKG